MTAEEQVRERYPDVFTDHYMAEGCIMHLIYDSRETGILLGWGRTLKSAWALSAKKIERTLSQASSLPEREK